MSNKLFNFKISKNSAFIGNWSLVICLLLLVIGNWSLVIYAQGCPATDYDCQIAELQKEYDSRKDAHEKNVSQLTAFRSQLSALQKKLIDLDKKLKTTEKEIVTREAELETQQELLSNRLREMYKRGREFTLLAVLFSSKSVADFNQGLALRRTTAKQDWQIITGISQRIAALQKDKESLKKNQTSFANLKSQVDKQAVFLEGEVKKVEAFFGKIEEQIAAVEAMKAGGFSASVGETPDTLEPCSGPPGSPNYCDPGFSPAFAVFSFGAPHRTGMSQYGAYGRSKSGQSAETILSAYYIGASLNKSYVVPGTIGVSGYGRISLEDNYLLGIYEVPESWGNNGGFEALKAQAVAARSYALAVTNNGSGTICPTENCQVYKPQLKTGKWAEAVKATRGWVMVKDGSAAKTYFASTSGGYTINQWGWTGVKDTNGDWPAGSYEKISGSPWFYKAWYKTRVGKSCGRGHPWLNQEEMVDILNALIVYRSGQTENIWPVDYSSCSGKNVTSWSLAKMKEEANNKGGAITSISEVSVVYGGNGSTLSVSFSTNRGNFNASGDEFYKVFNLRAPGLISLKSSLFNIVRK